MNNTLGDALQKVLYANFIWKGEKIKKGKKYVQESERIIDMSPQRLKECWNHCEKMLRNDNPKHLGRYNVLEEITSQINKCNVELFLRYLENTYIRRENCTPVPRFKMMLDIRKFISNSEQEAKEKGITLDWNTITINHLSGLEFPAEFQNITISDALDGCTDNLGGMSKQHLTMTFITKKGIWFTKAEENELKGETNSIAEKLKIAKEKLHLPSDLILRYSEKGLSYHEMRAMLTLPKRQKYSDMTTDQLVTLRNKVLLRLSREIDSHIFNWERLQKQIELVAKNKGINLNE